MTHSSFVKNMLFLDLEYKHPIRGRFTAQLPPKAMHIPLNISQIEINFSGKLFNILYIVFASPGSKVYFCEPAQGRRKIDNWGGGGGGAHIHIFVLCPINFF